MSNRQQIFATSPCRIDGCDYRATKGELCKKHHRELQQQKGKPNGV